MRFEKIVPKGLVAWPPQIIPTLGQGTRWAIPTRCLIALAAAFTALLAAAAVAQPPASDPPKKVVIPFDFESKFDNGEYGQAIGELLWAKLHRQGGFVIPESMQDVRDWCQRTHMIPGPETTLEKMKEVVAKEQAGDIGIWGKIERVQGFETDVVCSTGPISATFSHCDAAIGAMLCRIWNDEKAADLCPIRQ